MGAPVVHFEIYGKDASKLQSFYADLFGWEIHADNPMNYGIVHTNSGDKGIGGGITEGDARVKGGCPGVGDRIAVAEKKEGCWNQAGEGE